MGNKDKKTILAELRDADGHLQFDTNRYRYLVNECDIFWRRAAALILSEAGYSSSGIGNLLDVTSSTASGYIDDLEDAFGLEAVEAHPQSEPQEELWPDGYSDPYNN